MASPRRSRVARQRDKAKARRSSTGDGGCSLRRDESWSRRFDCRQPAQFAPRRYSLRSRRMRCAAGMAAHGSSNAISPSASGVPEARTAAKSCSLRSSRTSPPFAPQGRSEEHTSELQSHVNLVCRLLLEKKKKKKNKERKSKNNS